MGPHTLVNAFKETSFFMTDFDSPWKESLEIYFEPFVALFFPEAHGEIDWERGHEFPDKELQQITRDAKIGRRTADKPVKVWFANGLETWILVHVEVQAQEDPDFSERMFVYHYRIFDRYHRQVVSLAVLADDAEKWRPGVFSYGLWGCRMRFDYPVIKLLDYRMESNRPSAWEGNPFAVVVRVHLMVLENRRNPDKLFASKFELVKQLYTAGWTRQEIVDLFRFIDWLMELPKAHERLFWEKLTRYEEGRKMSYVGNQKGRGYFRTEGPDSETGERTVASTMDRDVSGATMGANLKWAKPS